MAVTMPLMAGGHPVPVLRPGTVQTVTVGATSAATTNGVGASTEIVRLVSTTDCHYTIAASPTATTSLTYLPSGVVEFVQIAPGHKVAFIQASAGGTAFVTEMS